MKLIGTLLLTLALVASGGRATDDQEIDEEESIFQKNFRTLHQRTPPPAPQSRKKVETLWITQKLDNFNENDKRTWEMRYMANDELYSEGGPLFVFVGGEGQILSNYLTAGHWYDMAKEHNGYLFHTEHRYYGKSRPTKDLTAENLQYLNVRQALADLAHFIRTMKASIPGMANSKVFLAGGSYSASMVTWFKKLYPELATGCWASSAPLYAKADFVEFNEVIGQSIRLMGGDACYQRIQNAISELEDMLANNRGAEVKAMLKICDSFDESNDMDIYTLFSGISEIFAGAVQYYQRGSIENVCNRILTGDSDLQGFATYLIWVLRLKKCTDFSYKALLNTIMDPAFSNNIMRQWIYQTCNELGWYQTTGSRNQPFGTQVPLRLYISMCADAYGKQYTNQYVNKSIAETNKIFGGLSPNVENVYMTHGQLDPWSAAGIRNESQATIIPELAHCADFDSISPSDSAELRASKEKLAAQIREWMEKA